MFIFNNGKYKSILAAEAGELTKITETVQKDKDFRPHKRFKRSNKYLAS